MLFQVGPGSQSLRLATRNWQLHIGPLRGYLTGKKEEKNGSYISKTVIPEDISN